MAETLVLFQPFCFFMTYWGHSSDHKALLL